MANYKLVIGRRARKQIRNLDSKKLRQGIEERIQQLKTDPHNAPGRKKITGSLVPNTYRIRQNNYRIVFTIDNKRRIVTIVEVANRDAVYKNLIH